MEKMREMGFVMMKGRDDGMESKMGCGQREVRWREEGDGGLERKRAQRWRGLLEIIRHRVLGGGKQ